MMLNLFNEREHTEAKSLNKGLNPLLIYKFYNKDNINTGVPVT